MPELAIYLRTYSRASFRRRGVNSFRARSALILHEQTRIAVTRLVWTAVILDTAARLEDHFQTVGRLKYTVKRCKIFWRSKGGFERTPSNPPCLRACMYTQLGRPIVLGGFLLHPQPVRSLCPPKGSQLRKTAKQIQQVSKLWDIVTCL